MTANDFYHQNNSNVPRYGTEEYNRWYRANFGPTSLTPPVAPPPRRKKWKSALWVTGGIVVALVALGIIDKASGHDKTKGSAHHASRTNDIVQPTNDGDSSVDQLPSDSPTPDPTSGADSSALNQPIGSTIVLTSTDDPTLDVEVTVNSVASHRYPADWDPSYMDSSDRPANGRFLTINVTIESKSGSYDYNEWDFAVQESDGTQYDVTDGNSSSGDFEPELSSGTLDAGQKIRGNITFDVPTTPGAAITLSNAGELLGSWK